MKEIIVLFVRRPVTVIMIMAALVIAALFSLSFLSLDRLPELSFPKVTVETLYPGMAAAELRSIITIPVEDALSPVKGLERMRSISRDGASVISLDFRWGTDPMAASALVREAIDAVYPSLPQGVRKPAVLPGDYVNEAHALIAVRSLRDDGSFARNIAEYELASRLKRIEGTASVILAGGNKPEERLRLDVPRLAVRGLGALDFVRVLSGETADIPAGNAREGDRELVVLSSGRPASAEELAGLELPLGKGGLRVGDAGDLSLESAKQKSIFIYEGMEWTALEVYRRPGSDPVKLSRDIGRTLKEAESLFSRDAEFRLVKDSSPAIIRCVSNLGISAALGAVAVTLALLFSLRRISLSILAALSIPVSAAAGVCILALTGRSLNSMSLGGLAMGIGLVSDTAVIVLDLLHGAFGRRSQRPAPEETGSLTASIALSSIASTVTTVVVFVPVIFLPGPLGSLFGDTAAALASSVCAGWFYSQFCLPALYRFFFRAESRVGSGTILKRRTLLKGGAIAAGRKLLTGGSGGIEKTYRKILAQLLRRPLGLFAAAGFAPRLRRQIILRSSFR
jgi:multidrug efflux pump subunit AcrB